VSAAHVVPSPCLHERRILLQAQPRLLQRQQLPRSILPNLLHVISLTQHSLIVAIAVSPSALNADGTHKYLEFTNKSLQAKYTKSKIPISHLYEYHIDGAILFKFDTLVRRGRPPSKQKYHGGNNPLLVCQRRG
jgi:hypothetical protein